MMTLRTLALAGLVCLTLMGCGTTIPLFDSAEAQYKYAEDKVILADPVPVADRGGTILDPAVMRTRYHARQYRDFITAFAAVVDRYPNDLEYTPQSLLRMAEYHFQLRELQEAIIIYRDLITQYPDDEIIVVGARYGLGNVFLFRGQYNEAYSQYEQLVQNHSGSLNPQILELAQRALERMTQIRYHSTN